MKATYFPGNFPGTIRTSVQNDNYLIIIPGIILANQIVQSILNYHFFIVGSDDDGKLVIVLNMFIYGKFCCPGDSGEKPKNEVKVDNENQADNNKH